MNTKAISKKRPSDLRQVYISVDFEAIDENVWWSFGLIVSNYPLGNVIQKFQVGCDRSTHICENKEINEFWKKHPAAYEANRLIGGKNTQKEAEWAIVHFIREIKKKYNFFLISDNPAFDVKILDDILARNGEKAICFRKGDYLQCLDTWTFRLATMQILGLKSSDLNRVHANLNRPLREMDFICQDDQTEFPRHTPVFDACQLALQYFKVKDISNDFKNRLIGQNNSIYRNQNFR
jgi:hypothetical protein